MKRKKIVSIVASLCLICILSLPAFATFTNFTVTFPSCRNSKACAQGTKDYDKNEALVNCKTVNDNWVFGAYYYIIGAQNSSDSYHWVTNSVECDKDSYCYLPYDSTAKKGMSVILYGGCNGCLFTSVSSTGYVDFA